MMSKKKQQIYTLLKGIETGDAKAVLVVNENKYIQHNPLTKEGNIGLAQLFKRLAKMSPKVEIVRIFEDKDFVFAHTYYDFNVIEVGFEIFRFENGFAVEHWDNLQLNVETKNTSPSMIDGSIEIKDLDLTEVNRAFISSFIKEILIEKNLYILEKYIDKTNYIEHNPYMKNGLESLRDNLQNEKKRNYNKIHRLLAEGNFVLCISEGYLNENHTSFYDLFRISEGKIVEHWDTINQVPERSEWVNDNGKF